MVRRQEELLRQQMASQHQEEEVDEDMFPTVQVVWEKKGSVRYTKQLITDLFSKVSPLLIFYQPSYSSLSLSIAVWYFGACWCV